MPFAQLLRREGIPAEARETETLLSIQVVFAGNERRRAHLSLLPGTRDASAIALHGAPLAPEGGNRRVCTSLHFQRSRADRRWRSAATPGGRGVPARLSVCRCKTRIRTSFAISDCFETRSAAAAGQGWIEKSDCSHQILNATRHCEDAALTGRVPPTDGYRGVGKATAGRSSLSEEPE